MTKTNIKDLVEIPDKDLIGDDFLDLDKLDSAKLRDKALDELNLDRDKYDEAQVFDPKFSTTAADQMLKLEAFAEDLEQQLRGRKLVRQGDKEQYIQDSKALCGDAFIRKAVGVISTYAKKVNMLSKTKEDIFIMNFENAYYTISDAVLDKKSNIPAENHTTILKMIKDTFWAVWGVLGNTGRNMDAVFQRIEDHNKDLIDKSQGMGKI